MFCTWFSESCQSSVESLGAGIRGRTLAAHAFVDARDSSVLDPEELVTMGVLVECDGLPTTRSTFTQIRVAVGW